MMDKAGVYVIEAPSGGCYIGSAVNIRKRWNTHRMQLRLGTHHCIPLQRAWKKHGSALSFRVLLICEREDVRFFEQRALDVFKTIVQRGVVCGWIDGRADAKRTREVRQSTAYCLH